MDKDAQDQVIDRPLSNRKFDGLSGRTFGYLYVIGLVPLKQGTKWECRCVCGAIRYLNGSQLVHGYVKSCGCKKLEIRGVFLDLTNKRFGKLLVKEIAKPGTKNSSRWKYICDCGEVGETTRAALTRHGQISCGCITKNRPNYKNRKPDTALNSICSSLLSSAFKRNLEITIGKDEIRSLVFQNCHYCGSAPSNSKKNRCTKEILKYNGLDRKDNSKGYTIDNVVPCCWVCNDAKSNRNYDEFLEWIHAIHTRLIGVNNEA